MTSEKTIKATCVSSFFGANGEKIVVAGMPKKEMFWVTWCKQMKELHNLKKEIIEVGDVVEQARRRGMKKPLDITLCMSDNATSEKIITIHTQKAWDSCIQEIIEGRYYLKGTKTMTTIY